MALGDVLARLSVELSLNSAAFEAGAKRSAKASNDLGDRMERLGNRIGTAARGMVAAGAAIAGAFAINFLKNQIREGLDYASSLGEVAQQLGVTTRSLQQYRFAATQVGLSTEDMDNALAKLTRSIGEAEEGAKTQAEAFKRLGVSTRDAKGQIKDAGDLLPEIAEGLKGLHSPAERAAVLVDLFGRSGQKLAPLLADGAQGVNSLRDAAQRLGIVLSDAQIQRADETADKIAALNTVLQAKISSAVADNADSILELVNALIKLVEYAGKAARAWRIYVNAIRGGKSVQQAALDDLGPGVQLTFDPAEIERRKRGGTFVPGRGPLRGGAAPVAAPAFLRRGSTFTPGKGPTRFADSAIEIQVGRNTQALAALQAMAAAATAAGQRAVPVLENIARATSAANDNFAKMGDEAQRLFEALFPDEADSRQFAADVATLDAELKKGTITLDRYTEALRRLNRERMGLDPNAPSEATAIEEVGPLVPAIEDVQDAIERLGDRSKVTTVQIAQSFKDMADATLASLSQLSGAIKGGGFLDILSAVIGLGLQLGSLGVFGKGVAQRINAPQLTPPKTGTPIIPKAGGSKNTVEIIDTTGLFVTRVNGQIMQSVPATVQASSQVTQSQLRYRQSRRVA